MRHTVSFAASFAALMIVCLPAFAAEETGAGTAPPGEAAAPAAGTTPSAAATPAAKEPVLTQEEKAEKEARKACKIKICDILATKDPQGDDVSCDIVKTWRGEDIAKMLGGKIDWPWGNAVCQSKLELQRAPLAKAMSEASYVIAMPSQTVRCTLAQKDKGEPYVVEIAMAPKVTFKDGKASEATINWGEAQAPLFVYPLVYAGTGLDNQTNVLGTEVVRMVNEFAGKKCAEVKSELPSATGK
ncbi:MAG TPA: hypothetical protein VGN85_01345 [Methyloceanibacter sp.]|nr:hypothetical protein [Methyloceanibacter sp.]